MLLQGCAFQQVISGSSSIKGFDEKFTEVVLDKELSFSVKHNRRAACRTANADNAVQTEK